MQIRPFFFHLARPIQRYAVTALLLAAFLTVAALLMLIHLSDNGGPPQITVAQQNGKYDLASLTIPENAVVLLPPGETYYPLTYLAPDGINAALPENVAQYDGQRIDYLSQRFQIALPDTNEGYALIFSAEGRQAMRVYVNGKLSGQSGNPGTSKDSTEVGANGMIFFASPQNGKLDVILHIAQFHHYRYTRGVVPATLSLQKSSAGGWRAGAFDLNRQLLTIGALLCAAALLLFIYFLRWNAKATLYFALACIAMAVRESIQSATWLYFPVFSGNTAFLLKYLTVPLLTIFLSLYLGQLVSGVFLLWVKRITLAFSLAYGLCVLLGDSLFYTKVLLYYQILLVGCIITGVGGIFYQMRKPAPEQAAALFGIAVFFVATIWDVFFYSERFASVSKASVSNLAMLVFVLAETISIFLMNNRLIAEARQAEQALATEKAALESLSRMKTELLSNVSHELKTPLTVMSGYAQSSRQLFERPEEIDRREAIRKTEIISSEAERLSLMIGQVLDATRIEEGRMEVSPIPCHLDEIIHRAVDTYYPILNKNGNRLNIQLSNALPLVLADPARISQVIVNLISNAVRHTQNGSIIINAQLEDAYVKTVVSDTGAGIEEERLSLLFERYYSHGGSSTGTGLGLYICQYIVNAHGGSIQVESKLKKGTSVSFTLPISKACP